MAKALYWIVEMIAKIHNYILRLNDSWGVNLSDKWLHFIVIGLLGIGMFFVINPIIKRLVNQKRIKTISWIYVFTLIIVITFSIEIGQKVTDTGCMEFADIVFGVFGFFCFLCSFSLCFNSNKFLSKNY